MPDVSPRVHELRVQDRESRSNWRIFSRIDRDAILVIEWFAKKTRKTPRAAIDTCEARLERYDGAATLDRPQARGYRCQDSRSTPRP